MDLPVDILAEVFRKVPLPDLNAMSQVNRTWNSMFHDELPVRLTRGLEAHNGHLILDVRGHPYSNFNNIWSNIFRKHSKDRKLNTSRIVGPIKHSLLANIFPILRFCGAIPCANNSCYGPWERKRVAHTPHIYGTWLSLHRLSGTGNPNLAACATQPYNCGCVHTNRQQ